jgi:hypothetical protein
VGIERRSKVEGGDDVGAKMPGANFGMCSGGETVLMRLPELIPVRKEQINVMR